MSDPSGFWPFGSELRMDDGSGNFAAIPGCQSFTGPSKTRDMIEFLTHSSPGGYKERVSGPRDSGTIGCDIVWTDDPMQVALEDAYASDDAVNFQLFITKVPSNNLYSFAGLVQTLEPDVPTDNVFKKKLTLQITGPIDISTE